MDASSTVGGGGTISGGTITVDLSLQTYSAAYGFAETALNAGGSWHVVLMLGEEMSSGHLLASNAKHNFGSNARPSMAFAAFTQMASSAGSNEVCEGEFATTFPGGSTTLDNFFYTLTDGEFPSYAAFKSSEYGIPLYKNSSLTGEYSGGENVTAVAVFYASFPFWYYLWWMMGWVD